MVRPYYVRLVCFLSELFYATISKGASTNKYRGGLRDSSDLWKVQFDFLWESQISLGGTMDDASKHVIGTKHELMRKISQCDSSQLFQSNYTVTT